MNQYATVYDFCKENRVECTQGDNGIYNCYINYTKDDNRPWGNGSNILEAIDNAVVNHIRWHSQHNFMNTKEVKKDEPSHDPKKLMQFFNEDSKIFRYWFANKHEKFSLIQQYEYEASTVDPAIVEKMQSLIEYTRQTIEDINFKIDGNYPAIHNVWIQLIVYYESPALELWENSALIRDLVNKIGEKDKEGFYKMQEVLAEVEAEIEKINE